MNHDVFISYSSKNRTAAQEVCNVLEENDIRCWIAPRNITAGAQYGDLIEDAIKTCKVVVVLFSESAAASQWVSGELNVAFEENKIIIPLRIDQTPLKGQNRVMLNQRHWIDGSADYRAKFTDLVLAVSQATGSRQDSTESNISQQKQQTAAAPTTPAAAPVAPAATPVAPAAAPVAAAKTSAAPSPNASASAHKQFSGPVELKYGRTAKSVMAKRAVPITAGATPRPVSASGQPLKSAKPVTGARGAASAPRTTGSSAQNHTGLAAARQYHAQQHGVTVAPQNKKSNPALWKIVVPIVAGVILIVTAVLFLVL
ncbi:MAG: toll/interleukin-1 receptor domain-containing protein [Prevotella sp.]|nr:toll/interleukin-1 receptor domain-containing protein [Prevotella sp.]